MTEHRIIEKTFYSMQHVTGPGCVLVTLRFGKTPDGGPYVIKKALRDGEGEIQHDLERFLQEVSEGVKQANTELESDMQVEEVQVVADDFPKKGQVKYASYCIAKNYIEKLASHCNRKPVE